MVNPMSLRDFKKSPKLITLFAVPIVIFIAFVACCIKFGDTLLNLSLCISLISLIIVCSLCIFIMEKLLNSLQHKKNDLHIEKQELKKIALFFNCMPGEVDKIDEMSCVSELKYARPRLCDDMSESTQEEYCICYVKQKYKFKPSRKFELKLKHDSYEILLGDSSNTMFNSGFYIFTKIEESVLNELMTEKDLSKYVPEIRNGVVWLHCECKSLISDEESLKSFLMSMDQAYASSCSEFCFSKNVTVYESIIKSLFFSCPSDKNAICPVSSNDVSSVDLENFWINTPDGKAAMCLLSMFPAVEILGKKKFFENKSSTLNKRIKCVQDYINRNGVNTDELNFDYILNFLKKRIKIHDSEIPLYGFIDDEYPLIRDSNLNVIHLIVEDLKCDLYKYILAIASFKCEHKAYYANCLIRDLMLSEHRDFIGQVDGILGRYLDDVINDQLPCENRNAILKELSMDSSKEYTGKELIYHARYYLVNRYVHQVSAVVLNSVPIKIGPVEGMGIMFDQQDELPASVLAMSVINSNAAVYK